MVQTIWFVLRTRFPSGTLEFWYLLCGGCIWDHSLVKNLGWWASMVDNISLMSLQLIVGEHILSNNWKRTLEILCLPPPQDLPYLPFVFTNFALYFFSALNNNMMRTICRVFESSSWIMEPRCGLGNTTHTHLRDLWRNKVLHNILKSILKISCIISKISQRHFQAHLVSRLEVTEIID